MNTECTLRRHRARPSARRCEDGFTLIELTVAMVIFGFLVALGTGGWLSYQRAMEHRGSAQGLVSALRNAQQASLAQAVTYCISFDTANSRYQVYKFACGPSGSPIGGAEAMQSSRVVLSGPSFLQMNGSTAATLAFFPRGSATRGSVVVARTGSNKTYTISVEGLTGRVSLAG